MLRFLLLTFCFILYSSVAVSAVKHTLSETTGLSKWDVEGQGFSLSFAQLGADYVKAVFIARGLPTEVAENVSTYCVFGTTITNTSDTGLTSELSNWRIVTRDGVEHKLKLKSEWVKEWISKGVKFRWLLLSNQQNFDEGDWIQGFTTVALKPGSRFDLHYSWKQQGKLFNQTIKGMHCAPAKTSTQ